MLKIYNTLTREKQEFISLSSGKVGMYVCGMTIYDYCHLGHARLMVAFDIVYRWLKASGYEVTYVRNITDIDDKIIKRAAENNEPIDQLTARFIQAMHEDAAALGVAKPTFEPRATDCIPQIIAIIQALADKKLAYPAANGDVYYAVRDFAGYGKLSGKSLEDLRAGERVEVDPYKRDPLDFVLWKAAKPGEPAWDSPWGKGRPGWHIECSAMAESKLGEQFDIHGGGQDLQFPHHENEIAQSEGAHNHAYVNYWMHNGMLQIADEKMSKSLGNFFTIRDVLKVYDPEVVRFFLLRAQYRSQLNYSRALLEDAKQSLTRLYTTLKNVTPAETVLDWQEAHAAKFKAAMDDDFNTAEATAVLFELANEANKTGSSEQAGRLKRLANLLGILEREPASFLQATQSASGWSNEQIEQAIAARNTARQAKNFAEADRLRGELLAVGIVLEDAGQSTTWRRI